MTLLEYFLDHPALQSQWIAEKNTADPAAIPMSARDKLWWCCEKGHQWQASPDSRARGGHNCPYCTAQLVLPGETDLATRNPDKLRLWHPEKNLPLTPSDVGPGSRRKVWWRCEENHEWQASVYSVVGSNSGCPYCSGLMAIPGKTDLATRNPAAASLWDFRRNAPLTPSTILPGSKVKAWWKCERGHSWQTYVYSVALDGCGCPYCAGKKAIPGETDLATLCPEVMDQWDYLKNGDLDPGSMLPSSHEKVWWRCERNHAWLAAPYSRTKIKGSGCPYCTGRKVLPGFNDLATLKPGLAEQWYQPLNGPLTPADVTLGSNKKVWWRCSEHHVWQAFIYARTKKNGTDCPVCAGVAKKRKIPCYEERRGSSTAYHRIEIR